MMTLSKKEPQRTCIVCRIKADKKDLIMLTRRDKTVLLNAEQTLKGRSVYVCNKTICLKKILEKKGLEAIKYHLKVTLGENELNSIKNLINQ